MNPYSDFISKLTEVMRGARDLPLGGLKPGRTAKIPPDAPRALIFSPHPDDEVIIGGLPLRLLREMRMNVINVAVTQGSNKARQAERWKELSACCDYIEFNLQQLGENGLEGINLKGRLENRQQWNSSVDQIAAVLIRYQPRVIFFPHDDDWNITHIGTHHLVLDALGRMDVKFSCYAVETEFWGAMDEPNLMVESTEEDVTDLISALSFHVGEVRRNPYHLRMASWMMDNVRRGGELVGGQGGAAPDFLFATLYRLRKWDGGRFQNVLEKGRFLSRNDKVASLFPEETR
jgi:LmbE family N-acetylglucosaminyl deacetylase